MVTVSSPTGLFLLQSLSPFYFRPSEVVGCMAFNLVSSVVFSFTHLPNLMPVPVV
ncbi:hypothetical protein SLEP1_g39969 [Rubroshorea leprosula]|uniref:Uncharacterized protein n=1 Tax=Rubroshorea leprosula TaxID=152421 RepID=A0AAV5L268_9ROSI|nr:hypothetical protein SLEP1_g39969 [Rubroshorea leprosula]